MMLYLHHTPLSIKNSTTSAETKKRVPPSAPP